MSHPLDADPGMELFASYEGELKLVQADLTQKLDQTAEATGEERKAAIRQVEGALAEAQELVEQLRVEKSNVPAAHRAKANTRLRNYMSDLDAARRRLKSLADDRRALFGERYRYTDDPEGGEGSDGLDRHAEQRQQLLSGTERLGRSSARLTESQRIALETESIAAGTMADLHRQREVLEHARSGLLESEGYVDRSVKTLMTMARRMATNRIITVAIITVLVLLIFAVIYSKFH
ncbi:hypothetical protein KEM52_003200 [Ascosphaera acerosa]|nr:hypothetical protein KEM52_003200 [Ascosphaera acerosa]